MGRGVSPDRIGATNMKKSVLTAMVVAVIALAACAAPPAPEPSPPGDASVPSPSPTAPATSAPVATPQPSTPVATPEPSEPAATPAPTSKPKPTERPLSKTERYLLAGVLRGAVDCHPVRSDLPPKSSAGIECASDDPGVARVGFYYFERDEDLLAAYVARMIREGVALDSGPACYEGESEGPFIPWEGPEVAPYRYGCFINSEGYANLRLAIGAPVYIGILGRTDDMEALAAFAFRGSIDVPGFPTLWGER
jgi:hypothetical protein